MNIQAAKNGRRSSSVSDAPLAGGGSVKNKGTLEFALRPYRIPLDILREKHGPVLGMVTKILGEELEDKG